MDEILIEDIYAVGKRLQLRLPGWSDPFEAEIHHVFPPTMSVVLKITFITRPPPSWQLEQGEVLILKLYDRRFTTDLLDQLLVDRYTAELEQDYLHSLVQDPPTMEDCEAEPNERDWPGSETGSDPTRPVDDAHQAHPGAMSSAWKEEEKHEGERGGAEEEEEEWTPVCALRSVQQKCLQLSRSEENVYTRLKMLQDVGKVPRYISRLELVAEQATQLPGAVADEHLERTSQFARIPGALLSFENGLSLRDLASEIPRHDWCRIIEMSTSLISQIGDHDIINYDIRVENVLIVRPVEVTSNEEERTSSSSDNYRAVAIDFAQARTRRRDESDQEWKHRKNGENEEGHLRVIIHGLIGLDPSQPTPADTDDFWTSRDEGPLIGCGDEGDEAHNNLEDLTATVVSPPAAHGASFCGF